METYDAVVIGGGQAGLAAGYHLQRSGLRFVILEAGSEATGSWTRCYDSLKLFSPARYSSLPGMSFPGDPERYPTRDEVAAYLRSYARHFHLPIVTNTQVERVERHDALFHVFTNQRQNLTARSVIAATGAFSRPHLPQFEGQDAYAGQVLHSSAYINPLPFKNQQILMIGAGNSAVQIATELARTAQVTLTSREPVRFRRQRFLGQDLHFWIKVTGYDTHKRQFPQWHPFEFKQQDVLDTGIYQAAFQSGNPAWHPFFTHFNQQGVQWADGAAQKFDTVIFATGFRPNLPYLQALAALDEHGNPLHSGGISTSVAGLYYVGISGQRSFASATLRGVGADAAYVIRDLKRYLKYPTQSPAERCCFKPQTAL
ncbi:MAG: NAD(P)/FAD-dependent oxidoreductase [Anaerolineae bacterium]